MSTELRPVVAIDLPQIRRNAQAIVQMTGVPVLAVIKSDAYGLGAVAIASAIADIVAGFCVFSLEEALAIDLCKIANKPIVALGPPDESASPEQYIQAGVRPAVSTADQARRLRAAQPILCIDTGMQRFACPEDQVDTVLRAGEIREAFTHAIRLEQVDRLKKIAANRSLKLHAAATALLDEPSAWLEAVRPGLGLYRRAVKISAPLLEARETHAPAGYSQFDAKRHGVILAGYRDGLRPGPCLLGGVRRRVLEVGMQSSFIEIGPTDRPGDFVTLLGPELGESEIAVEWKTSPHQALVCLSRLGARKYLG